MVAIPFLRLKSRVTTPRSPPTLTERDLLGLRVLSRVELCIDALRFLVYDGGRSVFINLYFSRKRSALGWGGYITGVPLLPVENVGVSE